MPAVAGWAGEMLARLHGLAMRPADRSLFPVAAADTAGRWPGLAAVAPDAVEAVAGASSRRAGSTPARRS